MSALRLEVETHIVTASATAVQNLTKCVAAAGVKIDELVADSLAVRRGRPVRDGEGARRRGRRHRRGHDRPRPVPGRLAVPHARSCRSAATTSPTTSRSGSRRASRSPRSSRSSTGRRTCGGSRRTSRSASRSSARTPAGRSAGSRCARSSRPGCARRSSSCATRCATSGHGMLPAGLILTGGGVAAGGRRRARSRGPPDAGPRRGAGGHRRPRRHPPHPGVTAPRSGCSCGAPGSLAAGEPARYESAPAMGGLGRIRDALRSIFP